MGISYEPIKKTKKSLKGFSDGKVTSIIDNLVEEITDYFGDKHIDVDYSKIVTDKGVRTDSATIKSADKKIRGSVSYDSSRGGCGISGCPVCIFGRQKIKANFYFDSTDESDLESYRALENIVKRM